MLYNESEAKYVTKSMCFVMRNNSKHNELVWQRLSQKYCDLHLSALSSFFIDNFIKRFDGRGVNAITDICLIKD